MSHVQVVIVAVGDPAPFPAKDAYDSPCTGFAILEKGTVNGKTSCAVLTKDEKGKPITVQFTGDMFLMMASALKGARQRFGDPWNGD